MESTSVFSSVVPVLVPQAVSVRTARLNSNFFIVFVYIVCVVAKINKILGLKLTFG